LGDYFLFPAATVFILMNFARFHASAFVRLRSALFWRSVRRRFVVC